MNTYTDDKIKPRKCNRCKGAKREVVQLANGGTREKVCGLCKGSGKRYPLRREALAKAYKDGKLPEQEHQLPNHQWCPECRPAGTFKIDPVTSRRLADYCDRCKGRTIIALDEDVKTQSYASASGASSADARGSEGV